MSFNVLELVRPAAAIVPRIAKPVKKVPLTDKIMWTLAALVAFLVAGQVPLYGMRTSSTEDPLGLLRSMMASNRGTLMELGVSPIINAGLLIQFMGMLNVLEVERGNEEHIALHQALEKILGIFATIATAFFYVMSGQYGTLKELGVGNFSLLVAQLTLAGILLLMLDEMLSEYGLGSGISLFIAVGLAEAIVWGTFSPRTLPTPTGPQYEGAIPNAMYQLITKSDKVAALREAFYRTRLVNLTNLLATGVVFMVVVYFQGWRVELPIKYAKYRGANSSYPVKLFYTSVMPIMLQSALTSNFRMVSSVIYSKFPNNFLVRLLGEFMHVGGGYQMPVGGLAYYIARPNSLTEMIRDPIHTVIYIAFTCITASILSYVWLYAGKNSPREVAKSFKEQGIVFYGSSDRETLNRLNRYIPIAASCGGMCLGALTIFADFMGCIGSGTGMLLAIGTTFEFIEALKKGAKEEQMRIQMPGFGGDLF